MTPSPRSVLFVTTPTAHPQGGRAMLSTLNHALLADLFGDRLSVFVPDGRRASFAALTGHIDGLDAPAIAALLRRIDETDAHLVILDGSNRGAAARAIKRHRSGVRIVTLLHNVEARFFLGALRARPGPRALAILLANYLAERAAVRASDRLLCLSTRDSVALARLYGRGADAILPIALADHAVVEIAAPATERYALFVGGGFYANRGGIRWFARHVAPRLAIQTRIVGNGLGALAQELAGNRAVEVVGAVDSLARWYRDAAIVVAPIFDGSGMKTKVAEALQYGKRVIGTREAFSGYDDSVVAAGWRADDADGFVAGIAAALSDPAPAFDPALRALFDRFHSYDAARGRLATAFAELEVT